VDCPPEIAQLDQISIDKYVFRFYISMDDVIPMQIGQGAAELLHVTLHPFLGQQLPLDVVIEILSGAGLH
jgi:hypothetical protein